MIRPAVVLILLLALAACGADGPPERPTKTAIADEARIVIQ